MLIGQVCFGFTKHLFWRNVGPDNDIALTGFSGNIFKDANACQVTSHNLEFFVNTFDIPYTVEDPQPLNHG